MKRLTKTEEEAIAARILDLVFTGSKKQSNPKTI